MLPEIESFGRWLSRKYPGSSTRTHYTSDLSLFFTWLAKTPREVSVSDIDRYIEYGQQTLGYASSTLNRKLACLKSFYDFLAFDLDTPPLNPVVPRRHYLRPRNVCRVTWKTIR